MAHHQIDIPLCIVIKGAAFRTYFTDIFLIRSLYPDILSKRFEDLCSYALHRSFYQQRQKRRNGFCILLFSAD